MNFKKQKNKPKSKRAVLLEQVEEQSDLCDVKIKVGPWERKFHRCVLVQSPFFDVAMKHNYLENQRGTFEFKTGSPVTVEMALMYLYGKKPQLSIENVASIVEMAEFFMLPDLKSLCVQWLKTVTFTVENCMDILLLSSRHGFEIGKCTYFIEAHLPEVLQTDTSRTLTKDSVKYIFEESRLSYVPMNVKLQFLAKWLKGRSDRTGYAEELCKLIDFEEISPLLLRTIRKDWDINQIYLVTGSRDNSELMHDVLITKKRDRRGSFWCLDLQRENWYRLDSVALWRNERISNSHVVGVRSASPPELYFLDVDTSSALFLNLSTDMTSECKIPTMDTVSSFGHDERVLFTENLCLCFTTDIMYTDTETRRKQQCDDRFMRFSDPSAVTVSTVYIGYTADCDSVEILPVITLVDEEIYRMYVNQLSVVLLSLRSRNYVILYDITKCKMEKINLEGKPYDILPTNDGFVIFQNENISLLSLEYTAYATRGQLKHKLQEIKFELGPEYYFFNNRWFRYFRYDKEQTCRFGYSLHTDVVSTSSLCHVIWKPLPPPVDFKDFKWKIDIRGFHVVKLPGNKLRCSLNCPHCEYTAKVFENSIHYELEYYEDEISDDDMSSFKIPVSKMLVKFKGRNSDESDSEQDLSVSIDDGYFFSDFSCNLNNVVPFTS